jgi:site-specific DNA recombinase
MNAVIYARYSSAKQGEATIQQQLRTCMDYAISQDYKIVGRYIDRKRTGTNTKRPEFQRLIEESKDGFFQVVLVYKNDRFARSVKDSRVMKEQLEKTVSYLSP